VLGNLFKSFIKENQYSQNISPNTIVGAHYFCGKLCIEPGGFYAL